MPVFALTILYVDDPSASAAFYADLLGCIPVQASPHFARVPLRDGVQLGLWSRLNAAPPPAASAGGCEISFLTDDVDALHAEWSARGLPIVQPPVSMDFGRTFVALDPDGHRLRAFKPAAA